MKRGDAVVLVGEHDPGMLRSDQRGKRAKSGWERHLEAQGAKGGSGRSLGETKESAGERRASLRGPLQRTASEPQDGQDEGKVGVGDSLREEGPRRIFTVGYPQPKDTET